MEHTAIPSGEVHTPYQWIVADATARAAITPEASDLNKLCLQTGDNTEWRLSVLSPVTWVQMGSTGGGGATDHGALTGLGDDDHSQYHTDARGDARYSQLGHSHAEYVAATQVGAANGVAPLDAGAKIAAAYLPSYVDDVIEAANFAALPGSGETGKIYVTLDNNKTYRWSGSAYVEISASPGSTDAVTEGATNLYFTASRVLNSVLSGLSTATNAVISASDSVLGALGKLQAQITGLGTSKQDTLSNASTLAKITESAGNPLWNGSAWPGGAGSSVAITTRQSVQSASVDANGAANFLSIGTGLAVNVAATTTPIVTAFAAGFDSNGAVDKIGVVSADTTISSLTANSTCYLYADRNTSNGTITLGHSVLQWAMGKTAPTGTNQRTSGTNIGDLTGGGGLAGAFDGVVSQVGTACANKGGSGIITGFVGKDWGVGNTKKPNRAVVYAASDYGFSSASLNVTIKIQGSTDNFSSSIVDLETRSGIAYNASPQVFENLGSTGYRYHRALISEDSSYGAGHGLYCAELEFYELVTDQHWFDTAAQVMKRWTGSAWETKQRVFWGKAVTGASSVSSVVTYALRREYDSGWTNTLPAAATTVSRNHNIGTPPTEVKILVRFLTAEHNWAVGDETEAFTWPSSYPAPFTVARTAETLQFATGATNAFGVVNKTTGAAAAITSANCAYRIVATA